MRERSTSERKKRGRLEVSVASTMIETQLAILIDGYIYTIYSQYDNTELCRRQSSISLQQQK